MEHVHYVLGFFVPILLAGGAGYLCGRYHEQLKWRGDNHPTTANVIVVAVIPEYHQVKVRDERGWQYSIRRQTKGDCNFETLRVGDRLQIIVEKNSIVKNFSKL